MTDFLNPSIVRATHAKNRIIYEGAPSVVSAHCCLVRDAFAQNPVSNDLWDISQGTVITASSPAIPGYSIASMFGGATSFSDWAYFADGQPAGFVHFVEWNTQAEVDVGRIRMFAFGDGFLNNGREFAQVTLKAKSAGSPTYDITILSYTPSHPYTFVGRNSLLIDQIVPRVRAQSFRAEFVQYTAGFNFNGPRIVELDAFAPPPPVIATQPASVVVNYAMPAGFSVNATGTGSLQYQWFKDGSPIAGQTSSALSIHSAATTDVGSYSVSVTDDNGTTMSQAATLIIDPLNIQQSAFDLWDVHSGSVITDHSPYHPTSGSGVGMFGGVTAAPESYWTYFADNQATGTVHYVEWSAPNPVSVRTIRLFAHGDPFLNNGREFENLTIKAKSPGSSTFDLVVGSFPQTHPYTFLDNSLILDVEITPVVASAFRAEFTQYTAGFGFDGPRIEELDAFDTRPLVRPVVVLAPESKTVAKNTQVTFQVVARGGSLRYQWKYMGQNIDGETTDKLVLKHAKQTEQGYYSVVVSNDAGVVESAPALLLVTK